jgi:ABC-type nitrate/sulfonate/bicarbonate transport system permease component
MRNFLPPVIVFLAAALLAEGLVRVGIVRDFLLPAPTQVARALGQHREELARKTAETASAATIGFALSSVFGTLAAVAFSSGGWVQRAFYPYAVFFQTVPIIAIAPLLVIWFGYGMLPKVLIVALVCFFPVVVATFDGLGSVDRDAVRLVRAMGASEWQLFWRVRWPGALPGVFSGLRIGVTYGMVGAIVGEFVGASRGLGYYLQSSADQLLTERVFAGIAVSAGLSVVLFLVVGLVERLVVPWHRAEH